MYTGFLHHFSRLTNTRSVSATPSALYEVTPSSEGRRKRRKSQPIKFENSKSAKVTEVVDFEKISSEFVSDLLAIDEKEIVSETNEVMTSNGDSPTSNGRDDQKVRACSPADTQQQGAADNGVDETAADAVVSHDRLGASLLSPERRDLLSPERSDLLSPERSDQDSNAPPNEPISLVLRKDENENLERRQRNCDETTAFSPPPVPMPVPVLNGVLHEDTVVDFSSYSTEDGEHYVNGLAPCGGSEYDAVLGYLHILAENNALKVTLKQTKQTLADAAKENREMSLELTNQRARIEQLKEQLSDKEKHLQELAAEFIEFGKKFKTLASKFQKVLQSSIDSEGKQTDLADITNFELNF